MYQLKQIIKFIIVTSENKINGEYIKSDYLSYNNGVLSIAPGAFENLDNGTYKLALCFNDPYNTTITDKVTVKVTESGISKDEDDTTTE